MQNQPLSDAERRAFRKLCVSQGKTVCQKTVELMRDFLLSQSVKRSPGKAVKSATSRRS